MSTFILIAIVVAAVLGIGMWKERTREKHVRSWIAKNGGNFHWPFQPSEHPNLPARELTLGFESQGAHQWAGAVECQAHGRTLWLIEYSATPAGHSTGRWHCLFAEACSTPEEAHRICHDRNHAEGDRWRVEGRWVTRRDIGLISPMLLDAVAALIR